MPCKSMFFCFRSSLCQDTKGNAFWMNAIQKSNSFVTTKVMIYSTEMVKQANLPSCRQNKGENKVFFNRVKRSNPRK